MTTQRPRLDDLIGPDSPAGTPWVRAIMVSTLHGSATLEGTSGPLGNDLDSQLLMGLRDWADVVVVGSATVQAEDYGGTPARPSRPHPAPIAVLSRSLSIDPNSRFFTDFVTPPIIACPSTALTTPELEPARRALLSAGARLLDCGSGSVPSALAALASIGLLKVSCEGGPGVYSSFIKANAIDQLYMTLDSSISSTVERSIVTAAQADTPVAPGTRLRLEHCAVDADSTVFLRYGSPRAL